MLLTDDCIFALFEWLPLDDLCACSRTCKRLQILAEQHFRRKFQSKANLEVEVGIGYDGKLRVSPSKNYVKCFQKFIRNICIYLWTIEQEDFEDDDVQMSLVVDFMKRKCNKNLYRVCVEGDIVLDPFCKKIKNLLRSAETVVFRDRNRRGFDEATFLKYCPNITKLILEDGIPKQNFNAILEQKYRKLEHFYYTRSYALDVRTDKLKTFFQLHSNITSVAWMFHYNDDEDRALECLRSVDYVINLEHLFLFICRLLAEKFNNICDYLNVLCNRHNFQYLEMEFEGEEGAAALKANSNSLANLKQFTKVLVTDMLLTEVIPALRSLKYLKTIVLTDLTAEEDWNDYFDWKDMVAIADNTQNIDLPSIEEVHIVDIDQEQVYVYILQFVRHWSKLKRILLPACMYSDTLLHNSIMKRLNRERKKLRNACELTIFTNHTENVTNLDHDLVKLKFVEFTFQDNMRAATALQKYYCNVPM